MTKPTPSPYNEAFIQLLGTLNNAQKQAVEQIGGDYLIFRTSWMYSLRRSNFLKKVLTWARNNPVVKVVDDQIGNPTSARMLAEVTGQILAGCISTVYEVPMRQFIHCASRCGGIRKVKATGIDVLSQDELCTCTNRYRYRTEAD